MTSRRRRPTSPSPAQAQAQPLEDDDLLSEILLRLPAKSSSLPRASLVCKRWRRVVSDYVFLRRFRSHHGKPPLLGFFKVSYRNPIFIPTLDPPDRISAARFSLQLPLPGGGGGSPPVFGHFYHMFAFRHGRALIYDRSLLQITVWDPVTGDRRAVDIPEPFGRRPVYVSNWAMRCVDGHVHGGCHSSPFEVVVIGFNKYRRRLFTCVYSSDTGNWAQIDVLPEMHGDGGDQISPAEDGGLLFLAVRDFSLNLWKHKINSDSAAAGWVLEKTIELDRLLPFEPRPDTDTPAPMNILGFAEEHNVVFLATAIGVFMVNLESMQF
uniref:F-box domain-containing protein n=1 Tax=Oryza glaberrima TaxID=4538 RepID=I1QT31_ORYGL